jgi:hypothetical protein
MFVESTPQTMENERKPLLSDEDLWSDEFGQMYMESDGGSRWEPSSSKVRDFYESKITSGELRLVGLVKRIKVQETDQGFLDRCSACSAVLSPMDVWCPGCGEKIEP